MHDKNGCGLGFPHKDIAIGPKKKKKSKKTRFWLKFEKYMQY
jgi:hypothetical protein